MPAKFIRIVSNLLTLFPHITNNIKMTMDLPFVTHMFAILDEMYAHILRVIQARQELKTKKNFFLII